MCILILFSSLRCFSIASLLSRRLSGSLSALWIPVLSPDPYKSLLFSRATQDLQRLILKEVKGSYAILTLNRQKVNALDWDMFRALQMRYKELVEVDKVRGVILTGKLGVFSAGLDVKFLATLSKEDFAEWNIHFMETLELMIGSELITIAAISGSSPAGGTVLALTTDYRVMASGNYRLGLNEIGLELPEIIGKLATAVVGERASHLMTLTGKMFTPDEALKIGLVDEVVPADEVLERSEQVLQQWLAMTKDKAVRATKKNMRNELAAEFRAQIKSIKENPEKMVISGAAAFATVAQSLSKL